MIKSFRYKNSTISYTVYGQGLPVILLHGFAEDHTIWQNQVDALQPYCRLIVPDLPGSGKSNMLQQEDVSIEQFAECIYGLAQQETNEKCIVLGHSMGGYIALAFVEKYPEQLRALGFVHSTAFADSSDKKETRRKGIKVMQQYGAYSFIKNTTPNLFSEKFKKEHPEQVEKLIEKGKDFTTEALAQYYTAMMNRPDRTTVLANTKAPVLFVIGAEDVAAPLSDLLQQVHLPKISSIHIIKGVGHMSMLETTDQLNTYLINFINADF